MNRYNELANTFAAEQSPPDLELVKLAHEAAVMLDKLVALRGTSPEFDKWLEQFIRVSGN